MKVRSCIILITLCGNTLLSAGQRDCYDDAKKFCPPNVTSDNTRFMACLNENKSQLSQPCLNFLASVARAKQSAGIRKIEACGRDKNRICGHITRPQKGKKSPAEYKKEVESCFLEHEAEWSQDCRETRVKEAEDTLQVRAACRNDAYLCTQAEFNNLGSKTNAGIRHCLLKKTNVKLTESCREALARPDKTE